MKSKPRIYPHELQDEIEALIPAEIVSAFALKGWNVFGIFEIVINTMREFGEPICCPHCILPCQACGIKAGTRRLKPTPGTST